MGSVKSVFHLDIRLASHLDKKLNKQANKTNKQIKQTNKTVSMSSTKVVW